MRHFLRVFTCCAFVLIMVACGSVSSPKHDAIESGTRNLFINGPSGKIASIIETPAIAEDAQCPMVILMHGYGSQKNDAIMANVGRKLKERGIASIRFDFDGHGESEGRFEDMTLTSEKNDAKAVYDYIRQLPYVSTIGMAGHSQGGLITSILSAEMKKEVSATVLMAAAACLVDDARNGTTLGAHFDPNNIPAEGISVGGRRLGRNFLVEAQKLDVYSIVPAYTNPVCIIYGSNDFGFSHAQRYKDAYKNAELIVYPGDDHGYSRNFDKACSAAADFLQKHLMK